MSTASKNISTMMRVTLGILFLAHGIAKFQMGLGNVAGWFSSIGVPGFFGYVVAVIELVGGIALILGLFTRYVSGIFVIMLIGAIFTAKLSGGLMGNGQGAGYELDIAFILVALHLAFAPTTRLSLDFLFNRRTSAEQ
ncbi:DoxX family protein [Paenibacillus farraposensis]|uniref:DoxX family protein n=1 Tax=Paenibacillus farraposensis TaxID=2807095 RepID=A0ABW4DI98_9BACL|nr:DoxX family protein [Paenibacillus farraposensis]MCC3381194.1 DoxX family protein [Paenibacillus farraposensis]